MATATSPSSARTAEVARAIGDRARALQRAGRYPEARAHFDVAIARVDAAIALTTAPVPSPPVGRPAPPHPGFRSESLLALLVRLLNGRGMVGKYDGRHRDADADYRRALALELGRPEPDGQVVASVLHNQAGLAHAAGDPVGALRLADRGLAWRRRQPDDGRAGVARDEIARGAILVDLGRVDEAEAQVGAAAHRLAASHGIGDPDVVLAGAIVAAARHRRGDLGSAEAAYRAVLAAKVAHLGSRHPELAPTLNNLALLRAEQGDPVGARSLYRQALAILDDGAPRAVALRSVVAANLAALAPASAPAPP